MTIEFGRGPANGVNLAVMRSVAVRSFWGCLVALAFLLPSAVQAAPAGADAPLSATERGALSAGQMVSRPMRFDTAEGRYVGGVSYQIVEARPEAVLAALSDVTNWPEALPRTKSARLVGSADGLSRVELVQGSSLVDARYTVVLDRQDGETIRFWMDPAQPHDIRDVWGFFRVQALPQGRALVTVAAALDLGDGLARLLFEDRIASMMLHAPRNIRAFVEPRALALQTSSLR
jgi:hypothetical protein